MIQPEGQNQADRGYEVADRVGVQKFPGGTMKFNWLWHPRDCSTYGRPATVGQIVGVDFRPWEVISVREWEHPEHGPGWTVLQLRPTTATVADGADRDEHLALSPEATRAYGLPILRPRYGLCSCCGELMPCRHEVADREVRYAMEDLELWSTPGQCPACGEEVTARMESAVLPNTRVPGGPPATFHAGRRKCRGVLEEYRKGCPPTGDESVQNTLWWD